MTRGELPGTARARVAHGETSTCFSNCEGGAAFDARRAFFGFLPPGGNREVMFAGRQGWRWMMLLYTRRAERFLSDRYGISHAEYGILLPNSGGHRCWSERIRVRGW